MKTNYSKIIFTLVISFVIGSSIYGQSSIIKGSLYYKKSEIRLDSVKINLYDSLDILIQVTESRNAGIFEFKNLYKGLYSLEAIAVPRITKIRNIYLADNDTVYLEMEI